MPADNLLQSYAHVVVLDASSLRIRAVSDNVQDLLGGAAGELLGQPASKLFAQKLLDSLPANRQRRVPVPHRIPKDGPVRWGERQLIPFFAGEEIVLEIEPSHRPARQLLNREVALHDFTASLQEVTRPDEVLDVVCQKLADYLKFNRVITYRFEQDGIGLVSNEYNDGTLPSMAGLRFRAFDFPEEAQKLYEYETVLHFSQGDKPFIGMRGKLGSEASSCVNYQLGCRTPFSVLVQYMQEAGLQTIMSIALSVEGRPWGMLFCHAVRTTRPDYQLRTFAHLIGTLTGQTIAYRFLEEVRIRLLSSEVARSRMREHIVGAPNIIEGLSAKDPSLLDYLPDTTGAAICVEGQLLLLGITPSEGQTRELLRWGSDYIEDEQEYLATHHLEELYSPAIELRDLCAGVLLLPLNPARTEWIAWFRPERVEEILFGSQPAAAAAAAAAADEPNERFTPVRESRRGYTLPWTAAQTRAATELQTFVRDVVIERYTHLRRVNEQLKTAYAEMEDFSYMVSHDLRAPLRGIDGFAEILLEDYGTEIDEGGKELIQTIQYNAARMNQFIADILELSRVGRAQLVINDLDVTRLVHRALDEINRQMGAIVQVKLNDPLPPLRGDRTQLDIVFRQLLSNAIKFTDTSRQRHIEIGYRQPSQQIPYGEFYVSDNGIGIAAQHQHRVFGMFNRLVAQDEYAGNGVGLAIVRRIIQRHNGGIRIESAPGEGATFLFHTAPRDAVAD